MTLDFQIVPVDIKGLETKASSAKIVPGKLVKCQNFHHRKAGCVRAVGPAVGSSPKIIQQYNSSSAPLVAAKEWTLHQLKTVANSPSGVDAVMTVTDAAGTYQNLPMFARAGGGVDLVWNLYGPARSAVPSANRIFWGDDAFTLRDCSIARIGTERYLCFVAGDVSPSGARGRLLVLDDNLDVIQSLGDIPSAMMGKVLAVEGANEAFLVYYDESTGDINLQKITVPLATGQSLNFTGTAVTVTNFSTTYTIGRPAFDAILANISGLNYILLAFHDDTGNIRVQRRTADTSFTLTHTYTTATTEPAQIVLAWHSVDSKLAIFYTLLASLPTVRGIRLSSTLLLDVTLPNIVSLTNTLRFGAVASNVTNRFHVAVGLGETTAYGGVYGQTDNAIVIYDVTSGAATQGQTMPGVQVLSNPIWPYYGTSGPGELVLLCRFGVTSGSMHFNSFVGMVAVTPSGDGAGSFGIAHIGKAFYGEAPITYAQNSANAGLVAVGQRILAILPLRDATSSSTNDRNAAVWGLDFDRTKMLQSTALSDALIYAGAVVSECDGQHYDESGFFCMPQIIQVTETGGGSLTALGVYRFRAVYKWKDSLGQVHRSAPSPAVAITLTGANQTAQVRVSSYLFNNGLRDREVSIEIYRTQNAGSVYYLDSTTSQRGSAFAFPYNQQINSTQADTTLISGEALYTEGGVIENIAPEGASAVGSYKDRVFAAIPTRRELWYSKTKRPGFGVEFNDSFVVPYPPRGYGEIYMIAPLGDLCIVGCERALFYTAGEGPNDTGLQGKFRELSLISSDVGVVSPRGWALTPSGIVFKSERGIYALGKDLSVQYVGAAMEYFNDRDPTGALHLKTRNEVHFATSSGIIVFNYDVGEWSEFTLGGEAAYGLAEMRSRIYTSFGDDNTLYEIDTTDAGGTPDPSVIRTGWLSFAGVGGFQRVRRMILLGRAAAAGGTVKLAYDYVPNFVDTISLPTASTGIDQVTDNEEYGAGSSDDTPFEYRLHMPRQKCQAVMVEVSLTGGESANRTEITSLAFEVGIKKGLGRLKAEVST